MLSYPLHADPDLPSAWGPWFSHEYLAYYCVHALKGFMSLPPVLVKANPRYGEKLWPAGPKHIDIYKESYQEVRRLDPLGAFEYKKRNGDFAQKPPRGKTIEPWKILVIYSTEPDQYLDDDMILHKNQKIFGGSHGWRHMQFKLFGTTYGIAAKSFRVHQDLAKLAFENGNDYWGWRYLSRCGHYLADLGQPFHVKPLPGFYLVKKFLSRHELITTVSALHQGYEVYVQQRFREGFEPFGRALLQGADEGVKAGLNPNEHLDDYIKEAQIKHSRIFYYLLDHFGPGLMDAFGRTDSEGRLDAEAQIKNYLPLAARVMSQEENRSKLDELDHLTAGILVGVGRMLGGLYQGFLNASQ